MMRACIVIVLSVILIAGAGTSFADGKKGSVPPSSEEYEKLRSELSKEKELTKRLIEANDNLTAKYDALLKTKGTPAVVGPASSAPGLPQDETSLAKVLKEKAYMEVELKKIKTSVETLKGQIKEVAVAKSILETKFAEYAALKKELEEKITDETKVSDNLAHDLAQEKKDKDLVLTKMDRVDSIIKERMERLRDISKSIDSILE